MKSVLAAFVVGGCCLAIVTGAGAAPSLVNYQGRLTDTVGNPVNSNVTVEVSIYDHPTVGSQVYNEVIGLVSVQDGVYSFAFGSGSAAMKAAMLEAEAWLEVSIEGSPLSPRQRLLAVPYALRSDDTDNVGTNTTFASGVVDSSAIEDNSLTASDLAPNSVGSSELAPNSVYSSDVIDNTLTANDLGPNSVGASEIDTDAVGSSEIADSAVGSTELADIIALGDASTYGQLDVYRTGSSNTVAVKLDGYNNGIYIYGDDSVERARLYGPSYGELLLRDSSGQDTTVNLAAGIASGGYLDLRNSDGSTRVFLDGQSATGGGEISVHDASGTETFEILSAQTASEGAILRLCNASGSTRVSLDGETSTGGGEISVHDASGTETFEVLGAESASEGARLFMRAADGGITFAVYADDSGAGLMNLRNNGGGNRITMSGETATGGGEILVYDTSQTKTVEILGAQTDTTGGIITIGDADGSTGVVLDGDRSYGGGLDICDAAGTVLVNLEPDSNGGQIMLNDASGNQRLELDGDYGGGGYSYLGMKNASGTTTVKIYGGYSGTADGRVVTDELQITGGSDLSEQFNVASSIGTVEPGMLVCIDPENPGELVISTSPYDLTVAGVLSGAGGVKPGMLMGQTDTEADGQYPVALTGRVYAWADTCNGPIQPGDMLTTSDRPGHTMRVTDRDRAFGAVIGKAMSSLDEGTGLVLVLVQPR